MTFLSQTPVFLDSGAFREEPCARSKNRAKIQRASNSGDSVAIQNRATLTCLPFWFFRLWTWIFPPKSFALRR